MRGLGKVVMRVSPLSLPEQDLRVGNRETKSPTLLVKIDGNVRFNFGISVPHSLFFSLSLSLPLHLFVFVNAVVWNPEPRFISDRSKEKGRLSHFRASARILRYIRVSLFSFFHSPRPLSLSTRDLRGSAPRWSLRIVKENWNFWYAVWTSSGLTFIKAK